VGYNYIADITGLSSFV